MLRSQISHNSGAFFFFPNPLFRKSESLEFVSGMPIAKDLVLAVSCPLFPYDLFVADVEVHLLDLRAYSQFLSASHCVNSFDSHHHIERL